MNQKLGKDSFWDDLARIKSALPTAQDVSGVGGLAVHTHSGAAQGGPLVVGTTDTGATAGSVLFAGVGGVQQQDNANLFYDDTQDYFGVGTNAPAAVTEINAATASDDGLIIQTTDDDPTNNLTEWQNSATGMLAAIDTAGNFNIGTTQDTRYAINVRRAVTTNVLRRGFFSTIRANTTAGAITQEQTGAYGNVNFHAGANQLSNAFGLQGVVSMSAAATLFAARGSQVQIQNTGTGTITNAYGYRVLTPTNSGGGTITTAYGLQMENINTATTNYAILTNAGNIVFNEGGDAGTDFRVEGDTNTHLLYADGGLDHVGINVAAPAAKLEINAATASDVGLIVQTTDDDATNNLVEIHNSGGSTGTIIDPNADLLVKPFANSTTTFQVQQSGGDAVLVANTTNRRVGVGIAPLTKLHAYDATQSVELRIETDRANGYAAITLLNDAQTWRIRTSAGDNFQIIDDTNAATPMTIETSAPDDSIFVDAGGDVGIGGTPDDDLHVVAGSFLIDNTHNIRAKDSAGNPAVILKMSAADEMQIGPSRAGLSDTQINASSAANAIIIQAATGRVGINNTGPGAQLDVDQSDNAAAIPALYVDQGDLDQPVIQVRQDGLDQDIIITRVEVTGSPDFGWDESEDQFYLSKGLILQDGDLEISTLDGIIHADGVTAGMVLRADGTRYVPAAGASTLPIAPVAVGDTLIAVS